MSQRGIAIAAATMVVVFASVPVTACVCLEYPKPRKALRQATAVFLADAMESSDPYGGHVRLGLVAAWKGVEAGTSEITVFTPNGEACGFGFKAGQRYLVYAHTEPPSNWASSFGSPSPPEGFLLVSVCSRTALAEAVAEELKKLGRPDWTKLEPD